MTIRRIFCLFAPISMARMVCLVILAITVVLASQSVAGQQHDNAHLAQYTTQEEVKTRHILIAVKTGANAATDAAAKAKAQDVLNQLKAGASFAVLAMKYSDDLGSKDKGGELPWFPASQLVPAYANAAMALKPGQTSGLVRSQFGYHIIQLEKKQSAGERLTLSQVETLITHGVPDYTMSTQIQIRGLTFTPTPAILESLRAKGAGPQTLETIGALFPKGTLVSNSDSKSVASTNKFAIVIGPPSNVRVAPSAASGIICSVTAKNPIRILGSEGNWYKTDACDGRLGYIHRSQIKF